jgi:hypothetical protein
MFKEFIILFKFFSKVTSRKNIKQSPFWVKNAGLVIESLIKLVPENHKKHSISCFNQLIRVSLPRKKFNFK